MTVETIETIGFIWVKPKSYRQATVPFPNEVAIMTNHGWLLLAKIEKNHSRKVIETVLVDPSEIKEEPC